MDRDHVFILTPRGTRELKAASTSLTALELKLLVMIDGQTPLARIYKVFAKQPPSELKDVLLVGPGLISRDLRFNALPLYFSRPLRRIDYFLGKLGVVVAFLGLVLVVPSAIAGLAVKMPQTTSLSSVAAEVPKSAGTRVKASRSSLIST